MLFAVAAVGIGAVGILGVRSANAAGSSIAGDELATATLTSVLGRDLDAAYSTADSAITADTTVRVPALAALFDRMIPAVDADVAGLIRAHHRDPIEEQADLTLLNRQWSAMRTLLNPGGLQAISRPAVFRAELDAAFAPLSVHLNSLIARENTDAAVTLAGAAAGADRSAWGIAAAVVVVLASSIGIGWWGSRRIRAAMEPAQSQVEFADTLQLAENEDEATSLLQRHLQLTVPGGTVTVLNRNNSEDRLEAVTALLPGSPLIRSLQHAEPRSCLAVRSGRVHDQDERHPALLGCPVCQTCLGHSTCMPLTVGGAVIGSVLLSRDARYGPTDQERIRESVGQAAPVLANLRNLAIAELRAATDSLTALPNKRAVGDTLKRMVAQASRTLTPLCLLLLDLDHFKDINDRFGHPVGDQALANVGAALRGTLRESDFAGRNGGEEFAVLLPDTDITGAVEAAERIRAAIADITLPGLDVEVTASVGVAAYPDHATSAERLEQLADSALYLAKRAGRNRVEVAVRPVDTNSRGDLQVPELTPAVVHT